MADLREIGRTILSAPTAWYRLSDRIGMFAGDITARVTHNELLYVGVRYTVMMGILIGVPAVGVIALLDATGNPIGEMLEAIRGAGAVAQEPTATQQIIFKATETVTAVIQPASTPTPPVDFNLNSFPDPDVAATVGRLYAKGWGIDCNAIGTGIGQFPNAIRAALDAGTPDYLEPGPYIHILGNGTAHLKAVLPPDVWLGDAICVHQ